MSQILVDITAGVGTITLNRPDALNAITPTMLGELNVAVAALSADDGVHAIVLTGSGRAFSAGVDLKSLGARTIDNGCVGDILDVPARALTTALAAAPKPVIAAVNGFCFTGALELALACDIILVAAEAKLGDTHAKFGLRPTWGMSQRLPKLVGLARARELSFTARMISGQEAFDIGLAARVAPRDDFADALATLVGEVIASSNDSIVAYKDLYRVAESGDLAKGLAYEYGTEYQFTDTNERLADFL